LDLTHKELLLKHTTVEGVASAAQAGRDDRVDFMLIDVEGFDWEVL
jgi:hypothetical protein